MLVLTRTRNASVKIGEEIEVTVLEIKGETVRLGFTAPANVPIWRKELYDVKRLDGLFVESMCPNCGQRSKLQCPERVYAAGDTAVSLWLECNEFKLCSDKCSDEFHALHRYKKKGASVI